MTIGSLHTSPHEVEVTKENFKNESIYSPYVNSWRIA